MNKSNKLVRGIGTKGVDYPTGQNGKPLKEYSLWSSMLFRCTDKFYDERPSYVGVTCSENFKSYTFFYEWCQEQIGFGNKDEHNRQWQLDKDLLVKGNKIYSEDVCVFIPSRINSLVIRSNAIRGDYPIGVFRHNRCNKFVASCRDGKVSRFQEYLGYFNTSQEAFLAYKAYKEALIKQVANEYKEQLDYRVYEALMNYEVNEND